MNATLNKKVKEAYRNFITPYHNGSLERIWQILWNLSIIDTTTRIS